jgi:hypothetical protein
VALVSSFDTLLARVPLERIDEQARRVEFIRTALTVLAGLLWLIGWAAGKSLGALWLALAWSAAAVRVGWSDARAPRRD